VLIETTKIFVRNFFWMLTLMRPVRQPGGALVCLQSTSVLSASGSRIHRVPKKGRHFYFLNSSVRHWPILIIFGTQHQEETWRK